MGKESATRHVHTILVGQSTLFLEGLRAVLMDTRFDVDGVTRDVGSLDWDRLAAHDDVLIIADFGGHPVDPAEAVGRIRARLPQAKIMLLVDHYVLGQMIAVLQAGAHGYQLKSIDADTLVGSLELLALGQPILPPSVLQDVGTIEAPRADHGAVVTASRPLSDREKEILNCLVLGYTNKAIARRLEITEQTVKVHVKAILRKIRVRNRTQAAIWAVDNVAALAGMEAMEARASAA